MEYVFNGDLAKSDPVNIRLQARNIQVPETDAPWVGIRRFLPYEMVAQPFDLRLRTIKGMAGDVQIFVDNQYLTNANADQPFIVNPNQWKDGIHNIMIAVKNNASSLNENLLIRDFVVDRFDTFSDVPKSHWGHRTVEVMNHLGILAGRGSQRFEPDLPVSRQEFAKIIAETLLLKASEASTRRYEDVSDDQWSKKYIDALTQAGLIEGEQTDGKWYFYPERAINRAEAATIIGRTKLFADIPVYGNEVSFTDLRDIPDWAGLAVARLGGAKWINGYSDGTFRPMKRLSRAEASQIVIKFIGL
ncbi:S-layer homology domain-containing protein [Paenibacillus soyae]|uniref:S-layer homology domain-containing protein n=1 Tax=Paenibacillus soyae TaxID=2969249 RepID=A0A9X2MTV8_9BACL|nr:S-layer homology domain-containing protein [Paenibacillus soyae]MCR2805666.1 S-layer homology domain-containing protein [Paenibacillus soyae]